MIYNLCLCLYLYLYLAVAKPHGIEEFSNKSIIYLVFIDLSISIELYLSSCPAAATVHILSNSCPAVSFSSVAFASPV